MEGAEVEHKGGHEEEKGDGRGREGRDRALLPEEPYSSCCSQIQSSRRSSPWMTDICPDAAKSFLAWRT